MWKKGTKKKTRKVGKVPPFPFPPKLFHFSKNKKGPLQKKNNSFSSSSSYLLFSDRRTQAFLGYSKEPGHKRCILEQFVRGLVQRHFLIQGSNFSTGFFCVRPQISNCTAVQDRTGQDRTGQDGQGVSLYKLIFPWFAQLSNRFLFYKSPCTVDTDGSLGSLRSFELRRKVTGLFLRRKQESFLMLS